MNSSAGQLTNDEQTNQTTALSLWLLFGVAALLLGALLGLHRYYAYVQTERAEMDRLQALARVADDNLSIHLRAMDRLLVGARDKQAAQALVDPTTVAAGLTPEDLRYLAETTTGVRTLAVMDAQGNYVASNRKELIGKSFAERPYFLSARKTQDPNLLLVAEPFTTVRNVYTLTLTRPILGPGGEFQGAVLLSLDPEFFKSMLNSVLYADDLRCMLIHQDGLVFQVAGDPRVKPGINLAKQGGLLSMHQASGKKETLVKGNSVSTGDQRLGVFRNITPNGIAMDKFVMVAFTRNVDAVLAEWTNENITLFTGYLLLLASCGGWVAYSQRQRSIARIREQKMAQHRQLLASSEQMLNRAQRVGRIGSFAMGGGPEVFSYTEETARLFGLERNGETTFAGWFSRVHPDDQSAVEAAWGAALKGAPYDMTYRVVVAGQTIWIHALASLQFDEHGELLNFIGTVQDISDLKRAEEAQKMLLTIINQSPDLIATASLDQRVDFINPAGRVYLGVAQDASPPEGAIKRAHPEWAYRKVIEEGIPAALEHGVWLGETALLHHGTGQETPVSQLIVAHKDDHGQPILISTIIRDTSREVEQRRLIAEQAAILGAVISNASIGIGMGTRRALEIVNPALHRIFGYAEGELVGKSTRIFYPSDEAYEAVGKQMAQAFDSGQSADVQSEGVRKNGETLIFRFLLTALDPTDPGSRVVCIAEDITEREQLRCQIEQHREELEEKVRERTLSLSIAKQAAETADRFKSTILNNIDHEFRTPMTGILGFLDLALLGISEPRLRNILVMAEMSAKRLLATLTGLIDLATIESHRLPLEPAVFNATDLTQALRDRHHAAAEAKGITLTIGDLAEPVRLIGDIYRIGQILDELTGNAVKFSETGMVSVAPSLSAEASETILTVAVSDQGIGISPDGLIHIFEPFFQVDGSSTRAHEGSGIGLALCKRLAQAMGGTIKATSTPDKGSVFILRIPVAIAGATGPGAPLRNSQLHCLSATSPCASNPADSCGFR